MVAVHHRSSAQMGLERGTCDATAGRRGQGDRKARLQCGGVDVVSSTVGECRSRLPTLERTSSAMVTGLFHGAGAHRRDLEDLMARSTVTSS